MKISISINLNVYVSVTFSFQSKHLITIQNSHIHIILYGIVKKNYYPFGAIAKILCPESDTIHINT